MTNVAPASVPGGARSAPERGVPAVLRAATRHGGRGYESRFFRNSGLRFSTNALRPSSASGVW
jgi:hypothetical protein